MYRLHGPFDFLRRGLRFVTAKVETKTGIADDSVGVLAERAGIPVREVSDVNAESFLAILENIEPDVLFSVSAPQIFNEKLLSIPSWGCLTVHAASLPEYRGMMPNFWQMKHGREMAGLTAHRMNEDIDKGEVVLRDKVPIEEDDTLDDLMKRSKRHAADLVLETIQKIRDGTAELRKSKEKVSTTLFPTREDVRPRERCRLRFHLPYPIPIAIDPSRSPEPAVT
jgi:methionyl-tRNA formyltransferase